MTTLVFIAAFASALLGGMFFAFSSFVMPALGNIAPHEAMRAMQRINIDVFCWSFAAVFFGVPIASLGLVGYAVLHWSEPWSGSLLAGGLLNTVGSLGATARGNVPLNERLAKQSSSSADANSYWTAYAKPWVRWNSLRAAANLCAAAVLFAALVP
ncbi:MAG: DUF1772 domain-containing protein [Nannocystales bacterium]